MFSKLQLFVQNVGEGGLEKGGGTSWRFWRFWPFAVNFFFEITGLSVDHFGLLRRL